MSLIKDFILIGLIFFLSSCEKNEPVDKAMTKAQSLKKSSDVRPERIYIKVKKEAIFRDDFGEALKKGDLRFVGIMQFS